MQDLFKKSTKNLSLPSLVYDTKPHELMAQNEIVHNKNLPIIKDVSNGTEKLLRCVHSSMIPLMNCSVSLSLQCILVISIFFPLFVLDLKKDRFSHRSDVNSDMFHDFSGFFMISFFGASTIFSSSLLTFGLPIWGSYGLSSTIVLSMPCWSEFVFVDFSSACFCIVSNKSWRSAGRKS